MSTPAFQAGRDAYTHSITAWARQPGVYAVHPHDEDLTAYADAQCPRGVNRATWTAAFRKGWQSARFDRAVSP